MAETKKGYIIGAFFSSLLSVLLIIVSLATDSWVTSVATDELLASDSYINYGLFRGELVLNNLATPTYNTLYMTCLFDINACAVSCKTTPQAREDEVRALAEQNRPNPACAAVTTVDTSDPLEAPAVISSAFYICLLVVLFLQLALASVGTILAIVNATKNPTEPMFGLPGCIWTNVATAVLGSTSLLMFGIYWAASTLQAHLAFSYIAIGWFLPVPGLGYSYWILIVSTCCSLSSVALLLYRQRVLELAPPPPEVKIENHSDGTVFLY